MKKYKISLLPGDGIGPEITEVTCKLLSKVSNLSGFELVFEKQPFGGEAIELTGSPLPETTLENCRNSDAILMASIGDPKYDKLPRQKRPETGLLELRSSLDLFANIRPVKVLPALVSESTLKSEIVKDVDLVVVRELTGGIYFGKPKGRIIVGTEERAFNTMSYSNKEINRISKVAFEIAQKRRNKVCSIDKSNVLEVSQLWRENVTKMGQEYPNIELSNLYVDNAAMQLVKDPSQFDVLLTSNLFGDILSDQAAMLTGSIGMLPSASMSSIGPALFEPVHGSAPDIAGLNKANPLAMILSAAMMLRLGLNEDEAANQIEGAVNNVLLKGYRTADLQGESSTSLGCKEMGEKILDEITS
tara:strand:+ start:740 stop:1819 length:1080 start_codon:yes stop_codon:yes gene_type:complete